MFIYGFWMDFFISRDIAVLDLSSLSRVVSILTFYWPMFTSYKNQSVTIGDGSIGR